MTNVKEQLEKLLKELKQHGFGGLGFPEVRLCDVCDLTESYGLLSDFYWDYDALGEALEYWDSSRYEYDLKEFVQQYFPGCDVDIKHCQELEVIRRA